MKICYSTNGFKNHSLNNSFEIISALGFQGVEVAITTEHFPNLDLLNQAENLVKASKKHNIPITNLHAGEPFLLSKTAHYPSIITENKNERNKRIQFIKEVMELGNEIGCRNITITSGLLESTSNKENAWHILLESINRTIELLYPNMQLLIEQEPEMFVATTEDLSKLMVDSQHRLKINLDIGHLQVNGENISNSLKVLKDDLVNIHFEDIKNQIHQHLLPGQGEINFVPFFSTLKTIGYQGNLTADLYPFSHMAQEAATITRNFLKKFEL